MDDGRMPVAAWLWKAVVHRSTGAGIAFVCRNDPSRRTVAAIPPCGGADVYADGHWNASTVAGMSFRCTLQQLAEAIPEAALAIDGVDADVGLLKRPSPTPPPKSSESVTMADDDDDDDDGEDEEEDDDDDGEDEDEDDDGEDEDEDDEEAEKDG
uniref:DNA/RNA non-specific endonuclease domain-containing protein n=2 Tax=Schizaphis graminum TaxID=13262 RepID=A0A2S2NH30_SCHGA